VGKISWMSKPDHEVANNRQWNHGCRRLLSNGGWITSGKLSQIALLLEPGTKHSPFHRRTSLTAPPNSAYRAKVKHVLLLRIIPALGSLILGHTQSFPSSMRHSARIYIGVYRLTACFDRLCHLADRHPRTQPLLMLRGAVGYARETQRGVAVEQL
jgi:hypothetical protein